MRGALIAVFLSLATTAVLAQPCPKENPNGPSFESESRTLTGKVVFHDEIRQWFGLQLVTPICGLQEIQLLQGGGAFEVDESNAQEIETYRGCKVTVQGPLGIPGTGYYSANLYQNVDKITPSPGCILKPPFPDYSKARPSPSIHSYRVYMRIDYATRGGHIVIAAQSGNKPLTPWQTYARYTLTGGYVFYAYCADGFEITHFTGTPAAKPWLIDKEIAMDPETAASRHINHLRLDYVCRRSAMPSE